MSRAEANRRYAQSQKGRDARRRTNARTGNAKSKRFRDRLREWIQSLKEAPCADCGRTFDPVCMDFDHRPGEVKKFVISANLYRGREALEVEIAKCDVVCACCHRLRTKNRRSQ